MTASLRNITARVDQACFWQQVDQIKPLVPGLSTMLGRKLCTDLIQARQRSAERTVEIDIFDVFATVFLVAERAKLDRHEYRWLCIREGVTRAIAFALSQDIWETHDRYQLDRISLEDLDKEEVDSVMQMRGIIVDANGEGFFTFQPLFA